MNEIPPPTNEEILKRAMRMLINKVNRVTATWRHQEDFVTQDMVDLCNRQIEVEEMLRAAGIEV